MSLGNWKLKRGTTAHLLELLKQKKTGKTEAGKDAKHWQRSLITVGMHHGPATLEASGQLPTKLDILLPEGLATSLLEIMVVRFLLGKTIL